MSLDSIVAGAASIALLLYLFYTLLRPDRF